MATKFAVVAELLADPRQFVRGFAQAFDKAEGKAKKSSESIQKRFGKSLARGAGKVVSTGINTSLGSFTAAVAVGARSAFSYNEVMDDIRIQAEATDAEMGQLNDSITATSKATAISKVELAQTSKRLVDLLGPAGKSAALMDLLARAAVASGAKTDELAGLISAVSDSMGIAADDTERMEQALSAFLRAGKVGKVPLEQMASVLQDVSSTFAEVSNGGPEMAADLAAAMQVARKSFGSAEKVGTGLEGFVGSLVQNADRLKKLKIKVLTGKGAEQRLLPLRDILDQIQKRGVSLEKLTKALGQKEATKFAKALLSSEGRQMFEEIAAAGRGASDVMDDFAKRTESDTFRVKKASNDAQLAISELFTPERVEAFAKAVELVAATVATMTDGLISAGSALGKLAGMLAIDLGIAGDEEELGTPQAVAKDLAKRDRLAQQRAEATALGVMRGNVISEQAVEETAAEREGFAGRVSGLFSLAEALSPETRAVANVLKRQMELAGVSDSVSISDEAQAVSDLLRQRESGIGLRVGAVQGRSPLAGDFGTLDSELAAAIQAASNAQTPMAANVAAGAAQRRPEQDELMRGLQALIDAQNEGTAQIVNAVQSSQAAKPTRGAARTVPASTRAPMETGTR